MKEIALHILDIAGNSIEAGSKRIELGLSLGREGTLTVIVRDNGSGLEADLIERLSDPFFTSRKSRHVGMGVPLLKYHTELTGGKTEVHSENGRGTSVSAIFNCDHPDVQPLGDLAGCWILLSGYGGEIEIVLKCDTPEGSFKISNFQVREEIGTTGVWDESLKSNLKEYINYNLGMIGLTTRQIENRIFENSN